MTYRLRIGGRGHGKNAARTEWLRWQIARHEPFVPDKAPDVGEVRWACRRPTAPPMTRFEEMVEMFVKRMGNPL